MPDLFPFPGLRYQTAALDVDLGAVTAPPYDVIDEEGRARLEAAHPQNAVRLILPRDVEPGDGYPGPGTRSSSGRPTGSWPPTHRASTSTGWRTPMNGAKPGA